MCSGGIRVSVSPPAAEEEGRQEEAAARAKTKRTEEEEEGLILTGGSDRCARNKLCKERNPPESALGERWSKLRRDRPRSTVG